MLSYSYENLGIVSADFRGKGNWIAAKAKDGEVLV